MTKQPRNRQSFDSTAKTVREAKETLKWRVPHAENITGRRTNGPGSQIIVEWHEPEGERRRMDSMDYRSPGLTITS